MRQLRLDLEGMIVFTEAASGNYVVTPLIAAIGGARRVFAITADSQFGSAASVADSTYRLAAMCGVRDRVEVVFKKERKILEQADVVTNLGFVRPLDGRLIEMLKPDAVIPYMCEAWEFRPDDVDLDACHRKGIPVMATDEAHSDVDVFSYCGPLCVKMLLGLEIELNRSVIAIVSSDKFGTTIRDFLETAGASVGLFRHISDSDCKQFIRTADAIVIADYLCDHIMIGRYGEMEAAELAELNGSIAVVQFSGGANFEELEEAGIACFPKRQVARHRMGLTFADLGPKPVVLLHAAGLKVGEAMWRGKQMGLDGEAFTNFVLTNSPAQSL